MFRTQLFDAGDIPNVEEVQAGYTGQPLSAWLKQPPPHSAAAPDLPKLDKDFVETSSFEYLDFLPPFAPPGPEETAIRA